MRAYNALSVLLGFQTALLFSILTLRYVLEGIHALDEAGASFLTAKMMVITLTYGNCIFFVGAAARVLSLAALVAAIRGRHSVYWVRPRECASVSSWLFRKWNYFGKTGRQKGMRVLGLDIYLEGSLLGQTYSSHCIA